MNSTRPPASSLEDTARDFWTTRPVRPVHGTKLAGVAAAIAQRYRVDPTILRVAFVVAALYGGSGVLLYLLGWLLFRREVTNSAPPHDTGDASTNSTSATHGTHGTSGAMLPRTRPTTVPVAAVLVLSLLPTVFWVRSLAGVLGIAIGLCALYLLHRNYGHLSAGHLSAGHLSTQHDRAEPGAGADHERYSAASSTGTNGPDPASDPVPTDEITSGSPTPGSADPPRPAESAVDEATEHPPHQPTDHSRDPARSADTTRAQPPNHRLDQSTVERRVELPETMREAHPDTAGTTPFPHGGWSTADTMASSRSNGGHEGRAPRNRWITPLTLVLALLAGGITAWRGTTVAEVVAATLGILGLGMLAGSLLRGGRWLIPFAVVLAALAGIITMMPPRPVTLDNFSLGDRNVTMHNPGPVTTDHNVAFGDLDVDTRELTSHELRQPPVVNATAGIGDVTVHVPRDAEVVAHCTTGAGTVDCLGNRESGTLTSTSAIDPDPDTTTAAEQQRLVLTMRSGAGNLEVIRG